MQPPVVCPPCQEVIPPESVQLNAVSATCPRCQLVLALVGEVYPPVPIEGYPERVMRMLDVPEPARCKTRIAHDETRTIVQVGKWYDITRCRITVDRNQVTLRGMWGQGGTFTVPTLVGFYAVQIVRDMVTGGGLADKHRDIQIASRVRALTVEAQTIFVSEFRDWDNARYLSAELNRALKRHSPAATAYRG